MEKLHKLLKRQLTQEGLGSLDKEYPPESWKKLINRISKSYYENDKYVYLLERSAYLSHQELESLYKELDERRNKLQAIMSDGLCFLTGDNIIESMNAKAEALLQIEQGGADDVSLFEAFSIYLGDTDESMLSNDALNESLIQGRPYYLQDAKIHAPSGAEFNASIVFNPIMKGGELTGSVLVFRDESEQKKAEKLACTDSLTGLPNRNIFHQQLQHAVLCGKRNSNLVALLYLDLDGFKAVNDNYCHEVGDKLLCKVARRLQDCLRESDTVVRLGGDEFAVILDSIDKYEFAGQVAQKIINILHVPYNIDNNRLVIGCSIGIACFPQASGDIDELIKYADIAMYRSKKSGGNTYRFFHVNFLHDQAL